MTLEDIKLWNKISTKTTLFHKNYDMIELNDNIISEYDGTIAMLRFEEKKQPLTIGEFTISVWNLDVVNFYEGNVEALLGKYLDEDTYFEFNRVINETNYDFLKYKKIIFIHSLILRPDFRKRGVTEEFIEFIYRNFYADNHAIFALVKPIQENYINSVFYSNEKKVKFAIYNEDNVVSYESQSAFEYYSLNNEYEKNDEELNHYKLFSVASKCGFKRLGDGFLFEFDPSMTVKRLMKKINRVNNFEI